VGTFRVITFWSKRASILARVPQKSREIRCIREDNNYRNQRFEKSPNLMLAS
jgi:hypothetical protein